MGKIDFNKWLNWVFDHPVKKKAWYWDVNVEWLEPQPSQAIIYITELFNNPNKLLANFTSDQISQGLRLIASNSCSNHMFILTNETLELEKRLLVVESIFTLFKDLFANRCLEHLSHLDKEKETNPLNTICYMWWDILPIGAGPNNPQKNKLDVAILGVMEKTLELKSIACQESALHGLGHWQHYYSEKVNVIIGKFLQKNKNLKPELKEYAMSARNGCVQ